MGLGGEFGGWAQTVSRRFRARGIDQCEKTVAQNFYSRSMRPGVFAASGAKARCLEVRDEFIQRFRARGFGSFPAPGNFGFDDLGPDLGKQ